MHMVQNMLYRQLPSSRAQIEHHMPFNISTGGFLSFHVQTWYTLRSLHCCPYLVHNIPSPVFGSDWVLRGLHSTQTEAKCTLIPRYHHKAQIPIAYLSQYYLNFSPHYRPPDFLIYFFCACARSYDSLALHEKAFTLLKSLYKEFIIF